jgi:hypothetical protein
MLKYAKFLMKRHPAPFGLRRMTNGRGLERDD